MNKKQAIPISSGSTKKIERIIREMETYLKKMIGTQNH